MSAARKSRAVRATRAAQQVEDGLKLAAFRARQRAQETGAAMAAEADRTRELLAATGDPALRGLLAQAGVRHQQALETARAHQEAEAAAAEAVWHEARLRVRSLEKLVERLDTGLRTGRRLAENAEWQDVVTSRAGRPPAGAQAATGSAA
ncbi:MAG: hypothetical protein R2761_08665 [Acidimicrobiales bacterium]